MVIDAVANDTNDMVDAAIKLLQFVQAYNSKGGNVQ
jgi:hypothetical protein